MKKLLSLLVLAISLNLSLYAQEKAGNTAKFTADNIAVGKTKQDVPAVATFTFTNIGTTPLIIEKVIPSCSCTASDYTKTSVAPGKTGFVKASYNAHAPGAFNKSLSVKFAGSGDVQTLNFSGEVESAVAAGTAAR